MFLGMSYISKTPNLGREGNSLLFICLKREASNQAQEPPSQLELHGLEHSYIGLELEGGKYFLVFGSVKRILANSSLSLLL